MWKTKIEEPLHKNVEEKSTSHSKKKIERIKVAPSHCCEKKQYNASKEKYLKIRKEVRIKIPKIQMVLSNCQTAKVLFWEKRAKIAL